MSYKEGDYSYKKVVLRVLQEITVLSTFVSVGRGRAAESGGVIWQLCRLISVDKIDIKKCKALANLLKDGEELEDLMRLKPEEILKRWLNYHLERAGQPPVNNLGRDLTD